MSARDVLTTRLHARGGLRITSSVELGDYAFKIEYLTSDFIPVGFDGTLDDIVREVSRVLLPPHHASTTPDEYFANVVALAQRNPTCTYSVSRRFATEGKGRTRRLKVTNSRQLWTESGELSPLADVLRPFEIATWLLTVRLKAFDLHSVADDEAGFGFLAFEYQSPKDPKHFVSALPVRQTPAHGTILSVEEALSAGGWKLTPRSQGQFADIPLTRDGVLRFLREALPLLYDAGIPVRLPMWMIDEDRPRLRRTIRVSQKEAVSSGLLSFDRVVEFDWQLALGDQPLTHEELAQVAKLADMATDSGVIELRGEWVVVTPEQALQAAEILETGGVGRKPLTEVIELLAAERPEAETDPFDWLSQVSTLGTPPELPLPTGLQANLRPYQKVGFEWLTSLIAAGVGVCLADSMGLGKTIQTIAFLLHRRESNLDTMPALVVCPKTLVSIWCKELEQFAPGLAVHTHTGPKRANSAGDLLATVQRKAVVLTTYPTLRADGELLGKVPWSGVILDEAQTIKNHESGTAEAAYALPKGYRIALTGTPVENHVGDLWSLMHFLNPGLLGTWKMFEKDFFLPIQKGKNAEALKKLRRLVAPFILRRLKTDKRIIDDLPEKTELVEWCSLTSEQVGLYKTTVDAELAKLKDAGNRRSAVLALLTKLKQICNHPAQLKGITDSETLDDRSGKLERLVELLEEMQENKEKALIFTQYTEMGELLRAKLGAETPFLHGGLNDKERAKLADDFQSPAGPPVFILSLRAGGTGLTLTAASRVIHYDRWWNPAVEDQASDRAFRIGQTKDVFVHKFVCKGTVEERIDELISLKKSVADQVVGEGLDELVKKSDEELAAFFELSESGETVMEAAELAYGGATHLAPPKKAAK